MDLIYKQFFANSGRLSGKVFDSKASQLFRLERATDRLLPSLHPTSRPIFSRSAGSRGLEAHLLQLYDEGGASRGSLLARGMGMNKRFGRRVRENSERALRAHLNQLNHLLNQLKK